MLDEAAEHFAAGEIGSSQFNSMVKVLFQNIGIRKPQFFHPEKGCMQTKSILALVLLMISTLSSAGEIQFLTTETGFSNLQYSVKELSKTDGTSRLEIPGFATRSSDASRWMMCVYTNIALLRHKSFWTAVYPRNGDIVVVGFPESDSVNEMEKLGPEFIGEHGFNAIVPVEKMLYFCVHAGYKFKYAPFTK